MSDVVDIRADVIRVMPGAFEDHFQHDTVRLDRSLLRIVEPLELAGTTLSIVVDQGPDSELLRREGPVAFAVAREDLDLDVLFSGALDGLRDPDRNES